VTLLNGKVSTQIGWTAAANPIAPPKNPHLSAESKREGQALVGSENILICYQKSFA
jgi:hypothetical protein